MIVPATVAGLIAGMAVPAFTQVRSVAKEKTVTNNLRQIAAAAQQYFLETGETKVSVETLTGPDGYIRELKPAAGESYEGMIISIEDELIEVTLGDGTVISHPF
jgi:type IV pilus assembly protein PilA